jgi:phosphatidylserine/phosphatidylglycerophosphate/cardiolipin synthase-like enzyme
MVASSFHLRTTDHIMANFYADNYPKFFPLEGHAITWPNGRAQAWPGDAVPQMNKLLDLQGHRVESVIFGNNYFNWLFTEMDRLIQANAGGIFWVHGWFFDLYTYATIMRFAGKQDLPTEFAPAEKLDEWALYREGDGLKVGANQATFVQKVIDLEAAGVDVRIIGNSAPLLLRSRALLKASDGLGSTVFINGVEYDTPTNVQDRLYATFYNLMRLRTELVDEKRVIMNVLNHPLGGAHTKMVVLGNSTYRKAWTGGIDIAADRNHRRNHDVAVCVEGRAATRAAQFFKDLWNEISAQQQVQIRFSATDAATGTVELPAGQYATHLNSPLTTTLTEIAPLPDPQVASGAYVQMFRTLPRKNFQASTPLLAGMAAAKVMSSRADITLAQGKRLVDAMRKLSYFYTRPISFATKGSFEFKTVSYKAVDAARDYIWIIDQDATNFELMTRINRRIRKLRAEGHTLRVIIGTPYLTRAPVSKSSQFVAECTSAKQHELFRCLSESIPPRDHAMHFLFVHLVSHAKVILIDDIWAAIGSANCMRRSFYTDIEMGYAILHETWVKGFRKELFDSFMDTSAPDATDNWYHDFAAWSDEWELDFPSEDFSSYVPNPKLLVRTGVPTPDTFDNTFDKHRNAFEDPDSNTQI